MGFTMSLPIIYLVPALILVTTAGIGLIFGSTRVAVSYGLWAMLEENPAIAEKVPIVAMMAVYLIGALCAEISVVMYSTSTLARFDNIEPRKMERSGISARLYWTHTNFNETNSYFCAAAITAMVFSNDKTALAFLCLYNVFWRLTYIAAYLTDFDVLRSLAYATNLFATTVMFALALAEVSTDPILGVMFGVGKESEPMAAAAASSSFSTEEL